MLVPFTGEQLMIDRKAVADGVNYLIEANNFATLVRELTKIIEDWQRHPMVYAGDMACLNALIDVGLESREAFEKLVKLAESRRADMPTLKRVDYQRNLMRERRARIAKAVELQQLQYGKMPEEAKKRFIKDIQARWKRARNDYIVSKDAQDWTARNAATQEFWETLDRKLDINIREARKNPKV